MNARQHFLFRRQHPALHPPWSIEDSLFVDYCNRCLDCIEVCPEKIIIVGRGGFPQVDFERGECTFCGLCAEICRQPVFNSIESKAFHHQIMISEYCLTGKNVECRSCRDSCEAGAIFFRPLPGKASQPALLSEQCTGCGGCIKTCPVNAIKVVNHAVACV